MKVKSFISMLLVCMSFAIVTPSMASEIGPGTKEVPKEVRKAQIESRVLEIRKLTKSNLTHAEKRELKKEVKSLKKEANSRGIYLSVGAIIIIILLLILIL